MKRFDHTQIINNNLSEQTHIMRHHVHVKPSYWVTSHSVSHIYKQKHTVSVLSLMHIMSAQTHVLTFCFTLCGFIWSETWMISTSKHQTHWQHLTDHTESDHMIHTNSYRPEVNVKVVRTTLMWTWHTQSHWTLFITLLS